MNEKPEDRPKQEISKCGLFMVEDDILLTRLQPSSEWMVVAALVTENRLVEIAAAEYKRVTRASSRTEVTRQCEGAELSVPGVMYGGYRGVLNGCGGGVTMERIELCATCGEPTKHGFTSSACDKCCGNMPDLDVVVPKLDYSGRDDLRKYRDASISVTIVYVMFVAFMTAVMIAVSMGVFDAQC